MEELEQNQLWKKRKEVNSITTYFFVAGIITCFILNQGFYLILLFLFIIIAKSILGLFFENETQKQKAFVACVVITNVFYLFSSMLLKRISQNTRIEISTETEQLLSESEELKYENTELNKGIKELQLENKYLEKKMKELTSAHEEQLEF